MPSASVTRDLLQHDLRDAVQVRGIVQMLKHKASYGEAAGLNRPWECQLTPVKFKLGPNGIKHPLKLREGLWAASVWSVLSHKAVHEPIYAG